MGVTGSDALLARAESELRTGATQSALRCALEVFRASPEDTRACLLVARALARSGEQDLGLAAFDCAARGMAAGGCFLSAIAALVEACGLRGGAERVRSGLLALHGRIFALDPALKARPLPPSPPVEIDEEAEGSSLGIEDSEQILKRAAELISERALALEKAGSAVASHVPLFSEMSSENFLLVAETIELRSVPEGTTVLEQGGRGDSLFILVRGEVEVSKGPKGDRVVLSHLGEGSLFGEIAVLTDQPRRATVTATRDSELLELTREHVQTVARDRPTILEELVYFARRRLVDNLLLSSPLFRTLDGEDRMTVLKEFESVVVPPRTTIIEEETEPRGLYLVVAGELEISRRDEQGDRVALARVGDGEAVGEIALLLGGLTTATAITETQTALLFLERERFRKLLESQPAAAEHLRKLASERFQVVEAARDATAAVDAEELIIV